MIRRVMPFLALFSSFGTLICCALPALLVTLGLGASLASFLSAYPELIWFSEHKGVVFGVAGVMLLMTGVLRLVAREQSCPPDQALARACLSTRRTSGMVFYGSLAIYAIGVFFAFITPLLEL